MKKGFTLIELLVVVLIIGILAAVALPQYQKAVTKTRFTQGKILVHAIANAEEVYYLANGEYASDLENLDIQAPSVPDWSCGVRTHTDEKSVQCGRSGKLQYMIYLNHAHASLAGKRVCVAYNRDLTSVENEICKADTGNSSYGTGTPDAYTWTYL